jgi:hypothetical protein
MKCPETGTVQAYIDGELDIGMRKDLEIHIRGCEKCRSAFECLKENDDFSFDKLTYYKKAMENDTNAIEFGNANESKKATDPEKTVKFNVLGNSKGVYGFMQKYKKYITAACAVVVLATCLSIQPVRAMISDALSVFRVDNFKGLRITPQELAQLKENLSKGQGDFTLDKIGRIKVDGGQKKTVSQTELENSCSFPVISANGLKDANSEIQMIEPSTISFTLNVDNVNTILKSFKAKELLPDEIDGKTFSVSFGARASIKYDLNGKTYNITETTSPNIQVPEGVDADSLFNTLVNVPVFPDELKSRLASITDWKNTLYIPLMQDSNGSIDEVNLNGKTAYISSNEGKGAKDSDLSSGIIWMDNGVIYGIAGNTGKDDLIQFAGNLK